MIIDNPELLTGSLKARWQKLLKESHVSEWNDDQLFQEIVSAYSESHRFYHTLNHLNQLFEELDLCESVTNEMLWAVWYHDYVYKPGAKTNEKKSAVQAEESMRKLGAPQSSIDKVIALIMTTETHQSQNDDIDTQLFLDADMSILGSDEEVYLEYCIAVKQEHSSIPKFLFNRGRRKFLSTVLKQKSIFLSPYFKEKYEQVARENIKKELTLINL